MGGFISLIFYIWPFGAKRGYSITYFKEYRRDVNGTQTNLDCEAFTVKSKTDDMHYYKPKEIDDDSQFKSDSDVENKISMENINSYSIKLNEEPNNAMQNSEDRNVSNIGCVMSILSGTNIINSNMYGCSEVNWTDTHLQVQPGLNILAVCKNVECKFFLKDVMCPNGLYPERNGYCSFDREIHKVNCPICKQQIRVDNSFGFCFFECKFEIRYKLNDGKRGKIEKKASNNMITFAKCSSYLSGHVRYLELQFIN